MAAPIEPTAAAWFDHEAEWRTRVQGIDPRLQADGWQVVPFAADDVRPELFVGVGWYPVGMNELQYVQYLTRDVNPDGSL